MPFKPLEIVGGPLDIECGFGLTGLVLKTLLNIELVALNFIQILCRI